MYKETTEKETTKKLLEFIRLSPDCFHAVKTITDTLKNEGFEELFEHESQSLKNGGKYFVTRNASSVIAFCVPEGEYTGLMITSSHSDSPTYKIKPEPVVSDGMYARLNVEGYGGMNAASWLDRPLGVSGRVAVKTKNGAELRLVNIDEDMLVIPSLAIHMNRKLNDGYAYNAAKDMLPLSGTDPDAFMKRVAEAAGARAEDIISHDLFLYNRTRGSIWGAENEYFSSPRIDDLQCAYASLEAFISSKPTNALKLLCVFDNEEVGSGTKQGAKSTFLPDTLLRINSALGYGAEKLCRASSSGFMVSADNGHAVHPNHPEFADKTSRPVVNGGVLIKHNANQRYTTDAVSDAIFKTICSRAGVPYQYYTNRSDIPGGSTLGNLANEKLSLNTVDIGAAQLAMHSAYETGGVKDTLYLVRAMTEFYSSEIDISAGGFNIL